MNSLGVGLEKSIVYIIANRKLECGVSRLVYVAICTGLTVPQRECPLISSV